VGEVSTMMRMRRKTLKCSKRERRRKEQWGEDARAILITDSIIYISTVGLYLYFLAERSLAR